jgi:FlaA1/EpsC-like NDP-sugar epimerase
MLLQGVRVLGSRKQLGAIVKSRSVRAVLIAMPSAQPGVIQETVTLARAAAVPDVKILPFLSELYAGRVSAADLRTLEPADVLHREEVRVDAAPIRAFLEGECVLVTGAAGSIGSELCRQILRFGVKRLVALDFDETGLFHLESELRHRFPEQEVEVVVGDVRDAAGIDALVARVRPDVVYHAAAYKHVPMMERFPAQAIKTNVEGTRNVLESSCRAGCKAFVLISTDKAVNPTSVMGASKRVAEILVRSCQSASTRCLAVRFGNVLGSRGSVLRTFQGQVERRQAVTVTHPDMVRYFMLTSEAVQLVLQASAVGAGGQVFVLDMGRPVKILDLARDVIRFYGLEPDVDIPIVYTGIRPGEKLFEELLTAEEGTERTEYERLLVARLEEPCAGWRGQLDRLVRAAHAEDEGQVRAALADLVPTHNLNGPWSGPLDAGS